MSVSPLEIGNFSPLNPLNGRSSWNQVPRNGYASKMFLIAYSQDRPPRGLTPKSGLFLLFLKTDSNFMILPSPENSCDHTLSAFNLLLERHNRKWPEFFCHNLDLFTCRAQKLKIVQESAFRMRFSWSLTAYKNVKLSSHWNGVVINELS